MHTAAAIESRTALVLVFNPERKMYKDNRTDGFVIPFKRDEKGAVKEEVIPPEARVLSGFLIRREIMIETGL
jgi:hypothetical protein